MKSEFYLGRKLSILLIFLFTVFTTEYSFSQSWCIPTVTNYSNYNVGVTNMQFYNAWASTAVINNTTVAGNGVAPSYNNYSNLACSGLPGQRIKFSITVTPPGNGTQATIFVDWNNDGVFNTSGNEVVYAPGNLNSSPYTRVDSFLIPTGLSCGPRRIRVAADISFNTPAPCLSGYGEFEDYTLNVLNSGASTIDIAMNSIVSPASFQVGNNTLIVDYKAPGTTTVTTANFGFNVDNGTPVTVTGYSIPGGLAGCQTQLLKYTFTSPVTLTAGTHILKVWVNNPNGNNPDAKPANDTLIKTICTTIAGSFVIDKNGTGDFLTFADAIAKLQCGGIHGPVSFTVKPGTYIERVVIPQIYGASSTNTITFDGLKADTVILTYAGVSSASRSTVVLNGADYITFKNMTIQNTGTSYATSALLTNVADYNTFQNCKLKLTNNSSGNMYVVAIAMSETSMSAGVGNPASYNVFKDNLIYGGYYGAYLYSGSNSVWGYGNQFLRNNFDNQYYYGMYNNNQWGLIIQNNYIHNMISTGAYGIYNYWTQVSLIDGNIINPGQYGMYLQYENVNNSSNRSTIINNIICNFRNTSYQTGIQTNYYSGYMDILHNSIYVNGNAAFNTGSSYNYSAIFLNYYAQNIVIKNNLLTSTGTTLLLSAQQYPQQVIQCDYNSYYYPSSTTDKFYWYTSVSTVSQYHSDLTQFKTNIFNITNPHDANSYDQQKSSFVSPADLHLTSATIPLYAPTIGVLKDVDGAVRCTKLATLGADEPSFSIPLNTKFYAPDTIFVRNQLDFINPSAASQSIVYKWYLNGGVKSTSLNWSNTFNLVNVYTVKLVAEAICGGKDSTERTIVVINPTKKPIADFSASANFATTNDKVFLTDQSQNGCATWRWTITPSNVYDPSTGAYEPTYRYVNGTNPTTQNPVINLKYTGQYTICLYVSNYMGTDSICKQDFIVVRTALNICSQFVTNSNYGVLYDDGGPTANYSNSKSCNLLISPCSPNLTLNVKSFNLVAGDFLRIYDGYDNTGIKMYNTTSYPNGFTGNTIPTSFVSTTGKFYMEYVTDGATVSSGFEIEWDGAPKVTTKPKSSFTMSDTTICKGRTIYFTNTSTGYGNKYYWDLDGDGTIDANTVNTSFTYTGAVNVEMYLITENCGGIDTMKKLFTVYSPNTKPVVEFDADILNPAVATDIVTLRDKSYRCADQWEWTITPSTITYMNSTTKNSMYPQISFKATGSYTVMLVASCNGNADTLTKTSYINVLNFCTPVVSTYSRDIGISRVKLGSINNPTDITTTSYTNYSKTYSTNMFITFPYTITVDRLTSFNNISIYVWIDLNNDGDFTDAGERVAYTDSHAGLSWSQKFTIPATATEGKARMRIGTNFENLPNLPCGANLYGEYEDYYVNLQKDHEKPVITLNGVTPVKIEAGTTYSDAGVTVTDNMDTNISASIVTVNPVNTKVVGTYYVTYDVTDASGNVADQVKRQVIVTPDVTAPVLTLLGKDTMYVEVKTTFTDPGFTSIDKPWNYDYTSLVNVTGTVNVNLIGKYIITYKSTDSASNSSTKVRVVFVQDSKAPVITLKGLNPFYMEVSTNFKDPGYDLTDNYCDPATMQADTAGSYLNTSILGTQYVHYNLTDCNGNKAIEVIRTVITYDSTKPVLSFNPGQDTLDVEVLSQFADPGIVIKDNYYTVLSPVITGTFYTNFVLGVPNKLGFYTIIYTVKDGSNNSSVLTRVINVVDTKAPIIKLVGTEVVTVKACQWPNYVDQGYTISDNYYSVASIIIDTVQKFTNSLEPGKLFKVQYKATDGSGNVSLSAVRYIEVVGVSGITENMDQYITLYPNPTEGRLTINISLPVNEDLSVTMFDVMGKEKMNIFNGNIQTRTINLDLSNQAKGVYFVRFTYNNESYNKMIIVK